MWLYCYTPLDLHPLHDTQEPIKRDPRVGMGDLYALLGRRCYLNRSQANKAMDAFNKWWDKQRDPKAAVKAIWG